MLRGHLRPGKSVPPRTWSVACAAAVWLAAVAGAADGPRTMPAASLEKLDEAFAAAARDLARRAAADGHDELAAAISGWDLPATGERQVAVSIPSRLEKPAFVATPAARTIWDDFCAARRERAAGIFAHAVFASRAHDRVPTRDEAAKPAAADAPPLAQRSCAAVRLLALALRDDPDHERARAAGGWVRRGDAWLRPESARRLDKGEQYDPAFGWMPRSKLERYRNGERLVRGRWITAEEDARERREVKHGREFHSDHWEIVSAAGLDDAGSLAQTLEDTHAVWQQVFGGFTLEPADLEKRFSGRGRTAPLAAHSAILCADRGQYLAELEPLEPLIGRTNGIYWMPTKTIWFIAGPADDAADAAARLPDATTVHHEATHQLFAEARPDVDRTRKLAGERCGFWAIEAAACYMETIRAAPFGWIVGGRDAGRVPAAKERLDDGFFVPLADLCALGRKDFQGDERLPQIYSQIAGLADFMMNGEGGRYRESFVEYLVRVYAGTADPDTLSRLCKRSYADLDDAYRRHLSR